LLRCRCQHLLQLLGRDRQVLAVADPGFDLIAEARLLQLGYDRVQPALAAITSTSLRNTTGSTAPSSCRCALEDR